MWVPYYLWCDQATPATPPPLEEQVDEYGYTIWGPRTSCRFMRRPQGDETIPEWVRIRDEWEQGRHMQSNEVTVRILENWYTCTTHPGSQIRVFRQAAAYHRRFGPITRGAYDSVQFGRDIEWPAHVPERLRGGYRYAYRLRRPPARSTASLWS